VTQALAYSFMAMSIYVAGGLWTVGGATEGKMPPGQVPRFTVSDDKKRIARLGKLSTRSQMSVLSVSTPTSVSIQLR
jgi:hypothetical protein